MGDTARRLRQPRNHAGHGHGIAGHILNLDHGAPRLDMRIGENIGNGIDRRRGNLEFHAAGNEIIAREAGDIIGN